MVTPMLGSSKSNVVTLRERFTHCQEVEKVLVQMRNKTIDDSSYQICSRHQDKLSTLSQANEHPECQRYPAATRANRKWMNNLSCLAEQLFQSVLF